jgi:cobalt-zinc-cadmium efflux system outer membrane protein
LNQYGDSAWVATISIPLPLFDRKQGAIAEAQSRISKSVEEQKAIENMVAASVAEARQEAESANNEAATLRTSILPAAQLAFSSLEEGYRQGKFDYLQVLDAQRTYFELKGREIDAVLRAYTSIIRIHLLTGAIQETGDMLSMFDEKEVSNEK